MYFIIRKCEIHAGPFDNLDQVFAVPGCEIGDMAVAVVSGRAQVRYNDGGWGCVGTTRIMGSRIKEAMRYKLLAHEKANAISRRNDAELQDAIDEAKRQQAADMVNKPPHYNQAGIECVDAIAAATSGKTGIQAVCVANVIKYLWRYELKNGVEDVKKARWYLDRLIGELEK